MTIVLKTSCLINEYFFISIIILPMLNYFQLLMAIGGYSMNGYGWLLY
jgi:hypothetical protein